MSQNDETNSRSAEETVNWLTSDTVETLYAMSNAPTYLINATLKIMPLGSRASMHVLGITTATADSELTEFGNKVMQAIVRQREC